MNRKLASIATLFAAGAFAASSAPAPLSSPTRSGHDTSLIEAGCGGSKEGEKGKEGSCGKDKDGSCGKDKKGMKDGSCGKDKAAAKGAKGKKGMKGAKDGACGKDKKGAAGDKKDGEKGCGAACGSKKKDGDK